MNIASMPSHLTRWIPAVKKIAEIQGVSVNDDMAIEVVIAADAIFRRLYFRASILNADQLFANCIKMVFKNDLDRMAKQKQFTTQRFPSEYFQRR